MISSRLILSRLANLGHWGTREHRQNRSESADDTFGVCAPRRRAGLTAFRRGGDRRLDSAQLRRGIDMGNTSVGADVAGDRRCSRQ